MTLYREKVNWQDIMDTVERISDGEFEKWHHVTKQVVIKIYRCGTVIRIDIKEVS